MSFHQQRIAGFILNAAADTLGVGDEQIIANDLDLVSQLAGHQLPGSPVILRQAVFDRDDRIVVDPLGPEFNHLLAGQLLAFLAQVVGLGVFFVQFGGGRIERNGNIQAAAGFEASLFDGGEDDFDGLVIGFQTREHIRLHRRPE